MALRKGRMWQFSIRVDEATWKTIARQAEIERRGVCNMTFVLLEEALRARKLLNAGTSRDITAADSEVP